MRKIVISVRDLEAEAVLLDEERPQTCEEIWRALPLNGEASLYKEELYFPIPLEVDPEDATRETEAGDVSYWPDGPAFCIFFGDSQPVSPVNTFARIEGDVESFREVRSGEEVTVRRPK